MEFLGRDWCRKRAGEADPPTSEPHRVRAVVGDCALTLRKRLSV